MNNDDTIVLAGYSDDRLSSDWQNSILSTTLNTGSSVVSASIIAGAGLTTTATGTTSWHGMIPSTATASPYTISTGTYATQQSQVLKVTGNAEFEGDVKIKGVNLSERLDAIESRLGILRPNNDLEGKWEKLKALGEEYRNLEKEILEGESVWDILKK